MSKFKITHIDMYGREPYVEKVVENLPPFHYEHVAKKVADAINAAAGENHNRWYHVVPSDKKLFNSYE